MRFFPLTFRRSDIFELYGMSSAYTMSELTWHITPLKFCPSNTNKKTDLILVAL